MIFPDSKGKTSFIGKVWNYFKGSGSDSKLVVPSPSAMRVKCMEIHLESTRNILTSGQFRKSFDIHGATEGCISLFHCAYIQYVEHHGEEYSWILKKDISVVSQFSYHILN